MSVRMLIGAVSAATLLIAPAAGAHVTLNPNEWEAGGFARFAIRVPNERDKGATTKITVKFPQEILSASFQPIDGWRRTVKMAKLDEPIEVEGERVTEKIDTVTWSGGRIRTGEFEEFGVSFRMPEKAGSELAFPAVQTYSTGEVVRWIGPPDSEEPAPRVTVLEAAQEEEGAAATPTPAQSGGEGTARAAESDGDDTLSIIAIVLAALALATGVVALLRGRRAAPRGAMPT